MQQFCQCFSQKQNKKNFESISVHTLLLLLLSLLLLLIKALLPLVYSEYISMKMTL